MKQSNIKRHNILQLFYGLLILIFINIIAQYVFTRFDLTAEKRYTLSPATKKLLKEVDDIVYFKVYLDGEFPAGFKRLRNATREMLDEFRAYSDYIEYEFEDPNALEDPNDRQNLYRELVEKGLQPTDLQVNDKDGMRQQIIFPGLIVTHRGREIPVELLANQIATPHEQLLNNSVQNLEYELASAVRRLTDTYKPKIGFVSGHREMEDAGLADIAMSLSEYYNVERVSIDGKITSLTEHKLVDSTSGKYRILNKYKALIIARPDSTFSEKDKFILDQYVMRGGSLLWLIDPVIAEMDSLKTNSQLYAVPRDLNLEDMLFKYGVRINNDLVMDINHLPIMLVTGYMGNQPQMGFMPWPYFPLLLPSGDHPIVKNLNAVKSQFVSSIDTVGAKGIKKTILLTSSDYSRTANSPVIVDLNSARRNPDERLYTKSRIPVAVLLEGNFESLYKNRIPPELANNEAIGFIDVGADAKMIFISDGDVIRNQLHRKQGYPLPLGYDQDSRQTFGNKDLIMNAMNYLVEDDGLISVRSRDIKIRLLDKTKILRERLFWQILNTVLPVLLVIVYGIVQAWLRRRKYARKA